MAISNIKFPADKSNANLIHTLFSYNPEILMCVGVDTIYDVGANLAGKVSNAKSWECYYGDTKDGNVYLAYVGPEGYCIAYKNSATVEAPTKLLTSRSMNFIKFYAGSSVNAPDDTVIDMHHQIMALEAGVCSRKAIGDFINTWDDRLKKVTPSMHTPIIGPLSGTIILPFWGGAVITISAIYGAKNNLAQITSTANLDTIPKGCISYKKLLEILDLHKDYYESVA